MKSLKIAVCLKSVPDPKQWHKVTINPQTKTIQKEGIPRIISPLDRHALEAAVRLKEAHGGSVIVVCMGSPGARENIQEALALGADEAVFLSDRAFGGADSLATARALAAALKKLGLPGLIFCGAVSYYGSTGQVGPQIAQFLGINHFSAVRFLDYKGGKLYAEIVTDGGFALCEGKLPLLVTVRREINKPRGLRLSEAIKARKKKIWTWSSADLGLSSDQLGLKGSGIQMFDFLPLPEAQGAEILEGGPQEIAKEIAQKIKKYRQGGIL
ncbi:MAG: electron transfer flavoprotein subunit beta/FixA family protein [Dethiobacteria bacterium]|nr:electron transfer flavoprotein subunit beta/FixA family protein [Bacillota bacterium]